MKKTTIETPLGIAKIEGDKNGICQLKLQEEDENKSQKIPTELQLAVDEIQAYFQGDLKEFSVSINTHGTEFQKKVWSKLREIPYGKTISYAELARELKNSKAVRAVAAANGRNPVMIMTPCHRVIGSDGALTGYAGGLWRKKHLLAHESSHPQQTLF